MGSLPQDENQILSPTQKLVVDNGIKKQL